MALTRNQGISYLLCDDGIEVVLLQLAITASNTRRRSESSPSPADGRDGCSSEGVYRLNKNRSGCGRITWSRVDQDLLPRSSRPPRGSARRNVSATETDVPMWRIR